MAILGLRRRQEKLLLPGQKEWKAISWELHRLQQPEEVLKRLLWRCHMRGVTCYDY